MTPENVKLNMDIVEVVASRDAYIPYQSSKRMLDLNE